MADDVYLHAILSAAATHHSGNADGHDQKLQKLLGTTYRKLRSRLEDSVPSDQIIGAVTCMIMVEVWFRLGQ